MARASSSTSLADELFFVLPSLRDHPTESVLSSALLQHCRQKGVTSPSELLLLLTADVPLVHRCVLRLLKGKRQRAAMFEPKDLQHFTDKVLQALCLQHVPGLHGGPTNSEEARAIPDGGRAFISASVAELFLGTVGKERCSKNLGKLEFSQTLNGKPRFYPTGCPLVDHILAGSSLTLGSGSLEGGFCAGFLTEVFGESGAGKTQLVLQCLLQCVARQLCALCASRYVPELFNRAGDGAHKSADIVVLRSFATENVAALYMVSQGFPANRLEPLAVGALRRAKALVLRVMSRHPSVNVERLKKHLDDSVTERSIIAGVNIRRIGGIGDLLRLLSDGTLSTAFSSMGNCGVVVVDSIAAAVAGGACGEELGRGEATNVVATVGSLLKTFAVTEGAAVVVTNQIRSLVASPGEELIRRQVSVPALGMQWAVAPHIRVNLRRLQNLANLSRRQCTVMCGPFHQPGCCTYIINSKGICDDE